MLKEYHKHLLIVHDILIGFEPFLSSHLEGPVWGMSFIEPFLEGRGKEQEAGYLHVKICKVFTSLQILSLPPPSNCAWQQLILNWIIGSMEASFVQEVLEGLCEG